MKYLELTKGKVTTVDDKDYEYLNRWKWSYINSGYGVRMENGKMILMHRQIMNTPAGQYTDHINLNKLDNRKSNLRNCTPSQSMGNTRKRTGSVSIYKGVSQDKRRGNWDAEIWFDYKKHYLGSFKEERHAAMAYDIAAKDVHREFAYLNFPDAIHH